MNLAKALNYRLRRRLIRFACDYTNTHINKLGQIGSDFFVEQLGILYLERWYLIPRNNFFNLYLHRFWHSDEDRAMHDHRGPNMSYVLSEQGYLEVMPGRDKLKVRVKDRHGGSIVFRRAASPHRVVLRNALPVWSLFILTPVIRDWGFHCPQGWVPWQEFVKVLPGGTGIGKGCGDG